MTRVSICIPAQNSGRYIAATLDAALAQTYPDLEVIVVDDGSSDETYDVISRYERYITVLVNETPGGAAAARNRAFAASKGDAILYLDSDDLIEPTHVAALADGLARIGASGLAFGRWARFRESPQEAVFTFRATERDMQSVDWLLTDWGDAAPMTQCGMFLIPRHIISAAGGWDERLSLIDDFEFFARLISASSNMGFAPDARLYYRSGIQGSLSGQKSRKAAESQFLSLILGTGHLLAVRDTQHTRSVCAGLLQGFDYEHFPNHPDLRAKARARVAELGGSSLEPHGPPGFHALRRLIGWRAARRVQRIAEANGLNGAARHSPSPERHGA